MSAASKSISRVTGATWETFPMKSPESLPCNLKASGSNVTKLLRGFQPSDMDDRWMCRSDGPDVHGNVVVYFYRSWTGQEAFQLKAMVAAGDDESARYQVAQITELIWDKKSTAARSAEEAKDQALAVCRGVLGCELEKVTKSVLARTGS